MFLIQKMKLVSCYEMFFTWGHVLDHFFAGQCPFWDSLLMEKNITVMTPA